MSKENKKSLSLLLSFLTRGGCNLTGNNYDT